MIGASALSRRTLLAGVTGAGIAAAWRPDWALAAEGVDLRVPGIVRATIGIDTHNHIDVPLTPDQVMPPGIDLGAEMRRSGLSATCITFALDYQPLTEPGQAYSRFHAGLDAMDALLKQSGMTRP